ncbi:hypothetical protein D3C73_844950 [compost metagenome]
MNANRQPRRGYSGKGLQHLGIGYTRIARHRRCHVHFKGHNAVSHLLTDNFRQHVVAYVLTGNPAPHRIVDDPFAFQRVQFIEQIIGRTDRGYTTARHIHNHRNPAGCGTARSGHEILTVCKSRIIKMRMRINNTRQYQLAPGINDLSSLSFNILGKPHDYPFVNQNVCQYLSVALRNVRIFNDQIVTHEYTPLLWDFGYFHAQQKSPKSQKVQSRIHSHAGTQPYAEYHSMPIPLVAWGNLRSPGRNAQTELLSLYKSLSCLLII